MLGFAIAVTRTGHSRVPADRAPSSPLVAIAAEGWRATYPDLSAAFQPDSAPETLVIQRPGFDSALRPATKRVEALVTARVRRPWPDQAQLTAEDVALSRLVYIGDATDGVANDSTVAPPRPVANWIMPARLNVGDTLTARLTAFHGEQANGMPLAGVRFLASDGATTVEQVVSDPVAARGANGQTIIAYEAQIDISTLAEGTITLNAEVYPGTGDAASVLRSADKTERRGFSPRYFRKTSAAPIYAYLKDGASGGTLSSDPAVARADPFPTFQAATVAKNQRDRHFDDLVLRVAKGGCTMGTQFPAQAIGTGAMVVEPDPLESAADCPLRWGGSMFRLNASTNSPDGETAMLFRGLVLDRLGASTIAGVSSAQCQLLFVDCELRNNGRDNAFLAHSHSYFFGDSITGAASGALAPGAFEHRAFVATEIASAARVDVEAFLLAGNRMERTGNLARGPRSLNGQIVTGNVFQRCGPNTYTLAASEDVSGAAKVQNVFEFTDAASGNMVAIGHDGANGNADNIIVLANTAAGFHNHGRHNVFYDDGSSPSTSTRTYVAGNLMVSLNMKGDVFRQDGARTGNWEPRYGVNWVGNFTQFACATGELPGQGASFAQDFPGLSSDHGASTTQRNDPLFVDPRTTDGSTAGAGGGDYRLQAGSPAKGLVPSRALAFDLIGAPRSSSGDSAGAYV